MADWTPENVFLCCLAAGLFTVARWLVCDCDEET